MSLGKLLDMLSYRRPAYSATEAEFIERFIVPTGAYEDVHGNYHLTMPLADGSPSRVLWSSHTDTVSWIDGRQTLHYNGATKVISLSKRARYQGGSTCLGADDTAGVYLCLQMIAAKVPGHYVFHAAEERGGVGSAALAGSNAEWLSQFTYAIALDRRGSGDVITHQYGRRCASDLFAQSLACELELRNPLLRYAPAHGVYTDTAEYADHIPECTNLSVGYAHEHTPHETLDCTHLFALEVALCAFDETHLRVERVAEPEAWWETRMPHRIGQTEQRQQTFGALDRDSYLDPAYGAVQEALTPNECDDCGYWFIGDVCPACGASYCEVDYAS